jgi:putative aldouronate transport system substrate-binding protein
MKRKSVVKICLTLALTLFVAVAWVDAKAIYPLNSDVTVTYWCELATNAAQIVKNLGETEFAKQLQARTGVKIKFLHPPAGQSREVLNLMIAGGDLPDIIEYNWFIMAGGPNALVNDGVIMKLNPVMDKYAPNLMGFLKKNPQYDRMVKTDDGSYYTFPFIRADETLLVVSGPILRKDWMTELKLKAPTTIDEWYTILKTFKEKKGASVPLSVEPAQLSRAFAGAFDNTETFYMENGLVKFGGIEPNRKKYFTEMNKWYREGLLDNNYMTAIRRMVDANLMIGKSGATFGFAGSGIGRWLESIRKNNASFDMMGVPYPGPKKGVLSKFAFISPAYGNNMGSASISTKSKNVEAAARLLDYAYSKDGHMLYNFGVLNASYTMEDGNPTYTPLIMRNPNKLPNTTIMSMYMRSHYNGPFIQDKRYLEQYLEYPQQRDAIVQWKKQQYAKYMLPPITATRAESDELAKIMNDVNAYIDEMTVKFITGVKPLEEFDQFVAQVKKLNIDRAVAINQAALDRYNKR